VDLVAYALLLIRHLRFILACGFTAAVLMAIFVLVAKPRFSATAVMVLPQNNDKASALQAQLTSATADLLGGGIELYADILQSRSVSDTLIQQFDLQHEYHTKDQQATELILAAMTKVEVQREGLIRVTVQDAEPQRAADLANAYVQQLDVLNHKLVLTSVGERRFYLEAEMTKEKDKLADAEVALKQHQETTSGLPPEAQVSAALSALEATRVQLRSAQIRLEALLIGETDANPDVVRARREVEGLTAQLEQLERGTTSAVTGTPTTQVPAQLLDYTRLLREVKFHESLFELLEKQFEEAQLEESKTPSIVQVLDPAVPAKHKTWPPRTLYTLLAMIVGLFLGVFVVSLRAFVMAYVHSPQNAGQVERIKQLYRRG
jgi:uncharacterized protein involved in exopolysaccharide biosynthesis